MLWYRGGHAEDTQSRDECSTRVCTKKRSRMKQCPGDAVPRLQLVSCIGECLSGFHRWTCSKPLGSVVVSGGATLLTPMVTSPPMVSPGHPGTPGVWPSGKD